MDFLPVLHQGLVCAEREDWVDVMLCSGLRGKSGMEGTRTAAVDHFHEQRPPLPSVLDGQPYVVVSSRSKHIETFHCAGEDRSVLGDAACGGVNLQPDR